jgi:hypothetical protein
MGSNEYIIISEIIDYIGNLNSDYRKEYILDKI